MFGGLWMHMQNIRTKRGLSGTLLSSSITGPRYHLEDCCWTWIPPVPRQVGTLFDSNRTRVLYYYYTILLCYLGPQIIVQLFCLEEKFVFFTQVSAKKKKKKSCTLLRSYNFPHLLLVLIGINKKEAYYLYDHLLLHRRLRQHVKNYLRAKLFDWGLNGLTN